MTIFTKSAEYAVDDDPRVVEAREARERAERRRDDALEALLEAEEALDAAEEAEAEGEGDPAHRRALVQKLPGLKSDLRVAEKALEAARRREQEAFRAAVEDLEGEMRTAFKERIHKAHAALKEVAREMEALRQTQAEIRKLFKRSGMGDTWVSQLHWPTLNPEPVGTQGDCRVWAWERFIDEEFPWVELEDPLYRRNGKHS